MQIDAAYFSKTCLIVIYDTKGIPNPLKLAHTPCLRNKEQKLRFPSPLGQDWALGSLGLCVDTEGVSLQQ